MRKYVAELRVELFAKEAFVHRTHRPGDTMGIGGTRGRFEFR